MNLTTLLLTQYMISGANLLNFDWYFYLTLLVLSGIGNLWFNWIVHKTFIFEEANIWFYSICVRIFFFVVTAYSISQLVMIHFYPGLYVIKNIT